MRVLHRFQTFRTRRRGTGCTRGLDGTNFPASRFAGLIRYNAAMYSPPRPTDRRVQTICLLILTLIAIGVAMALLRPVLVPFVLALFFVQCLNPIIRLQIRHLRFPRWLAVSVATILGLALLAGAGFVIAASVGKMSQHWVEYRSGLDRITHSIMVSRPARWLGIRPDATTGQLLDSSSDTVLGVFQLAVGETANVVSRGASVLLLMAFLLYGHRPVRGPRSEMLAEIDHHVQRYISLTVFISTLTGVLVGATLSILGVQFAVAFGFLAFLLNFIPNIGAIIATVLPLPIVLLDPHLSIPVQILAIAIPAAVQIAIGSLVQPKMLGNSLQLHPVVLLLSLLFFTMIWGVPGAFLATPVTAVIRIVFERIPNTRPLAALLAGDLIPLTRTIETPEPKPQTAREPADLS